MAADRCCRWLRSICCGCCLLLLLRTAPALRLPLLLRLKLYLLCWLLLLAV